jgi:hypothetical protein
MILCCGDLDLGEVVNPVRRTLAFAILAYLKVSLDVRRLREFYV